MAAPLAKVDKVDTLAVESIEQKGWVMRSSVVCVVTAQRHAERLVLSSDQWKELVF